MRLPRQDTPLRLSAETPAQGIAKDEALLDAPGQHWWLPTHPALVIGLGMHHRQARVVDLERCRERRVAVLQRRAGGGAVFLDDANMLCGAISLPTASLPSDVTESYRWLGETLQAALGAIGIPSHRVEVDEARADVAALRAMHSPLLDTCYGALSPHELTVDGKKLVGLAQVRRRDITLFVVGILFEDQSPLADFLLEPGALGEALRARTVGLRTLTDRSASEVVAAIEGAMPFAP